MPCAEFHVLALWADKAHSFFLAPRSLRRSEVARTGDLTRAPPAGSGSRRESFSQRAARLPAVSSPESQRRGQEGRRVEPSCGELPSFGVWLLSLALRLAGWCRVKNPLPWWKIDGYHPEHVSRIIRPLPEERKLYLPKLQQNPSRSCRCRVFMLC